MVAMTAFIALLRGINVGGNRKIPMADLTDVFAAAGCGDVRTYIQSGNVVFTDDSRPEETLGDDLQRGIQAAMGFDVPVVLRRAEEWVSVIEQNPFPGIEPTKLHVSFLVAPPSAGEVEAVDGAAFAPEEFVVNGREVYLHLPDGMGRARLPPALGRTLLRSPATTRNWRTVEKLLDLVSG
jgi:uncharacterized protein (DUF1697 family)